MLTRQSKSAISAYDLSKALFLDTIEISGTARQNDTTTNLHLDVELPRAGSNDKLAAISGEMIIVRSGAVVATYNLTTFNNSTSGSKQVIHWDFTNGLPGGGLLNGDSIYTKTRYVVAVNAGLPQNDIQSGGRFFHYNIVNGTKQYCFDPIPEMYLVGTNALDGRNGFYTSGCNITSLGGSGSNLARRFNTSGEMYESEFRPVFYIDSVVMRQPEGYKLISMTNNIGGGTMTANSFNGQDYTFVNPGTWNPLGLTVTNTYGASFRYSFQPTCKTEPVATHGIKFYIKDFYYANATKPSYPTTYEYVLGGGAGNTASRPDFREQTVHYSASNNPQLITQNLTGDIQGSKIQHYWDVEVRNDGLSAAPYHWIALEKLVGSGISVDSVVNLATNQKLTENNYGVGNIWCPVDVSGIPSGMNSTVRVFFKYSNCSTDSILFKTGWNCANYPDAVLSDTSTFCSMSEKMLKVVPNESQLQLAMLRQPGNNGAINLCSSDSLIVIFNSAQAADLVSPQLNIYPPSGIMVSSSVEVEYPRGSGNSELVNTTSIPGGFSLDLSLHSGIGTDGLPGTISNQGSAGRQASIKLFYNASCDHVSGASISFVGFGDRICGGAAKGNGSVLQSGRIDINGASVTGAIGLDATVSADTFSCANRLQTLSLSATPVLDSSQVGDTVIYTLPVGLDYAGNFVAGSNCVGCSISTSNGLVPGTQAIKVALAQGIPPSTTMLFNFDVEMKGRLTCGIKQINVAAKRIIPSLMCDTMVCQKSSVLVGVFNKDIVSAKPTIEFGTYEIVKMTYQSPFKYVYRGTIKNQSASISSPNMVMHTFIDHNLNSTYDDADSLMQVVTIPTAIAPGATYSFMDSFTSVNDKPSPAKPLYSVIDTAYSGNNCMCNPDAVSIFLNTLPVELISFHATLENDAQTQLEWNVSSEINIAKYEMYRSTNNKDYRRVGDVDPQGNLNTLKSYTTQDDVSELGGVIYYKLKIVDQNGSYKWSEIRFVEKKQKQRFIQLTPNPANEQVQITFKGFDRGENTLQVINNMGMYVYSQSVWLKENTMVLDLGTHELPAGIYAIRFGNQTVRLVVSH